VTISDSSIEAETVFAEREAFDEPDPHRRKIRRITYGDVAARARSWRFALDDRASVRAAAWTILSPKRPASWSSLRRAGRRKGDSGDKLRLNRDESWYIVEHSARP